MLCVCVHVCGALATCVTQHVATPTFSQFFTFCGENFVIRSQTTKFTKISCLENMEVYDILVVFCVRSVWFSERLHTRCEYFDLLEAFYGHKFEYRFASVTVLCVHKLNTNVQQTLSHFPPNMTKLS